ncbi:YybS family protein [Gracilibacillus sp. HCP3S3_G5_1]|uniref:YybS family protein n=1 Tax=unclassified Gracilibacillus TaxID=2625209 RepID=UPI003F8C97BA
MDKQPVKKDFYIYVGIFILLLLLTILIPFLQVVTLVLLPIPVILLMKDYSIKWMMIAMLILLSFALFVAPVFSIPLTLLALISGGMIGWSIKQEQHPYETWAKGTAGYVLGLVLIYAYIETVLQFSVMDAFEQAIEDSVQRTEQLFQAVGMGQQDFDLIHQEMMNMLQLMPVMLVVVSMVMAIFTQWICYKVINKMRQEKLYFPPFRSFHLPKIILWIYFIVLLASFFVAGDYTTMGGVIVSNVYQLAGILMALQGLSFIFFYTHEKKQSLALPVISILLLVFFPFMGLYLLRILGIIDLGFELRKRMAK